MVNEAIDNKCNQMQSSNPLQCALINSCDNIDEEDVEEVHDILLQLDNSKEIPPNKEVFEELKVESEKEEKAKLVLKILPSHLKYVFLEEGGGKSVIISRSLFKLEEEKLVKVLKENKESIGLTISNLKGICPSFFMHKIMLKENFKPIAQPEKRLSPAMKDVVRKKMLNLLEAYMIYLISNSA